MSREYFIFGQVLAIGIINGEEFQLGLMDSGHPLEVNTVFERSANGRVSQKTIIKMNLIHFDFERLKQCIHYTFTLKLKSGRDLDPWVFDNVRIVSLMAKIGTERSVFETVWESESSKYLEPNFEKQGVLQ